MTIDNSPAPGGPPAVRRKSRAWVWILLLCLLAGGAYLLSRGSSAAADKDKKGKDAKQAGRPVPVVVAAARQGDMGIFLNGLGSVTALNTVTVRPRVDGQLIKVAFSEGQFVQQGDLLAEIDPRPFEVQLEQADGQMARDAAQLKNARLDLERYRVLLAQDSIPKQQFDTQAAAVTQIEGVVKSDQAAIDSAKLQLVYCKLTAPLSGRIGLRLVDQGNMVHANDANGLVVIAQVQPIAVLFTIAEDSLPPVMKKIRAGAKLRVDAYDRDISKKLKLASGQLLTVDNQIDQTSGTLRFKAVFANADSALFPNQFVNARLLVDTKRNTILAPTAAVQRDPQGAAFVYLVKAGGPPAAPNAPPSGTVEVRRISLGPVEGDDVSVDSGLSAGEVMVIDGVDKLQPGSKVIPRAVGAPAEGAAPRNAPGVPGEGQRGPRKAG